MDHMNSLSALDGKTSLADGKETARPEQGLIVPWLQATAGDLQSCDFEAPIAGLVSAESYALREAYRRAAQPTGAGVEPLDTAETRVFQMLWAVTGMHLKAREREEPFGPHLVMTDGRRSAIPADFRDGHIDLLADMAIRAAHPVLRARLADVCWLLDRKRGRLGAAAVTAYTDTVEGAEAETLKFSSSATGALEPSACDLLRRALHIGRTIGWDKPEAVRARAAVIRLRQRTTKLHLPAVAMWFAALDLDFGVSSPADV